MEHYSNVYCDNHLYQSIFKKFWLNCWPYRPAASQWEWKEKRWRTSSNEGSFLAKEKPTALPHPNLILLQRLFTTGRHDNTKRGRRGDGQRDAKKPKTKKKFKSRERRTVISMTRWATLAETNKDMYVAAVVVPPFPMLQKSDKQKGLQSYMI